MYTCTVCVLTYMYCTCSVRFRISHFVFKHKCRLSYTHTHTYTHTTGDVIGECGFGFFNCSSGGCIDINQVCDGRPDCLVIGDNSDEEGCRKLLRVLEREEREGGRERERERQRIFQKRRM